MPSGDERAARARAAAPSAGAGALEPGLEVHAGHGLTYDNVGPSPPSREIAELNIGHFLIGEAIFIGLDAASGGCAS